MCEQTEDSGHVRYTAVQLSVAVKPFKKLWRNYDLRTDILIYFKLVVFFFIYLLIQGCKV